MLSVFPAIKRARVTLNIPENDGTLIAQEEEASASIYLELKDEFSQESAAYLARAIATGLGNETTNNIVILDSEGNMLFTGDENYSPSGLANAHLSVKNHQEHRANADGHAGPGELEAEVIGASGSEEPVDDPGEQQREGNAQEQGPQAIEEAFKIHHLLEIPLCHAHRAEHGQLPPPELDVGGDGVEHVGNKFLHLVVTFVITSV